MTTAVTDSQGTAAAHPGRRRAGRRAWRRRGTVLLFLSPWIVGFLGFLAYPLLATVFLAFHRYNAPAPLEFVGLNNFRFMNNSDPAIGPAIRNSLWLMVIAVPCHVLFAFSMAMLLTRARRGLGVFRTIFYLPALAPAVSATLGFAYLLNPGTGPVNIFLDKIGIQGPLWFDEPGWAKPSLVLLGMWGAGNMIIIFLAALLDVPEMLYESADIDGASPLQRLRYVTIPMISPVLLFAVVIGVVETMQYFTQGYIASQVCCGNAGSLEANFLGSPEQSTLFFGIHIYNHGFRYFHLGYAAAMATLLFIAALLLTLVILRTSRHWVHHQGLER